MTREEFRRRMRQLLHELEQTDAGQVVAGVVDYVRANTQVTETTDHPRAPRCEPPGEAEGPITCDDDGSSAWRAPS
jgi:hypothetical protein